MGTRFLSVKTCLILSGLITALVPLASASAKKAYVCGFRDVTFPSILTAESYGELVDITLPEQAPYRRFRRAEIKSPSTSSFRYSISINNDQIFYEIDLLDGPPRRGRYSLTSLASAPGELPTAMTLDRIEDSRPQPGRAGGFVLELVCFLGKLAD